MEKSRFYFKNVCFKNAGFYRHFTIAVSIFLSTRGSIMIFQDRETITFEEDALKVAIRASPLLEKMIACLSNSIMNNLLLQYGLIWQVIDMIVVSYAFNPNWVTQCDLDKGWKRSHLDIKWYIWYFSSSINLNFR